VNSLERKSAAVSPRRHLILAAVILTVGILGVRGVTNERVKEILAAPIQDPDIPDVPDVPDVPLSRPPIPPDVSSFIPSFRKPPSSSPLPQTSTGNVNLGTLLVELNNCGVWDKCRINPCDPCGGPDGIPRPLTCLTEDGWIYGAFDEGSQSVGFFENPKGGPSRYVPSVFYSSDPAVFCERLNEYEEDRGEKMGQIKDFMLKDGWFKWDGKKDFHLNVGTNPGQNKFTMRLDGEDLDVRKVKVAIDLREGFGATISILTVSSNYLEIIPIEAESMEGLAEELREVLTVEYALRPL
jgi:hypothetical protein